MPFDPIVYIVDDDDDVRRALRRLFETEGYRVEASASPTSFIDDFDPSQANPSCLVLDLQMPEMSGLQLQELLQDKGSTIPIIFLSAHGDVSAAVKGMKAGAVDFVEKPFDDERLLDLVDKALTQDQEQKQSLSSNSEVKIRFDALTPREREIMGLVAAGHSNKEIARMINISHRTVESHRFRVMQKMQAHSLPDLIAMAVVCGVHHLPQD